MQKNLWIAAPIVALALGLPVAYGQETAPPDATPTTTAEQDEGMDWGWIGLLGLLGLGGLMRGNDRRDHVRHTEPVRTEGVAR